MSTKGPVLVDGANVAFTELSKDGDPKVSNLVKVIRILHQEGYQPITIIDASLRHQIDDPQQLEGLLDSQDIRQAPAGTEADYFILEYADELDAPVVSNDEYEHYQDQYPWIKKRRIPLMVVQGNVTFYKEELPGNEAE